MLDENFPTFFFASGSKKEASNVLFTHRGNEPEPAYSLRRLDASQPNARNRYAAAIYDAYVPDALYGETLIIPEWTQPNLSAEAIRQNGGVPPSEPILPAKFTIRLYNPDLDVEVHYKPKTWNSQPSWMFEMPQRSFRMPSNSTLDQSQSDPATSDITPKLKFTWRKDGSLSRDFACYLSGKSTTPDGKKKSKEPDITVSIFRSFKELTLYEPNLSRVEMQDFKGLEVVLLLCAVVIRDVYFTPPKEAFNLVDVKSSPTSSKPPALPETTTASANYAIANGQSDKPQRPRVTIPSASEKETEAEQARLRQQEEAERRERLKREKEAEKKTMELLKKEEKEARRRKEEIEKETERLRKLYGKEEQKLRQQRRLSQPPPMPPRPNQNQSARYYQNKPSQQTGSHYLQVPGKQQHHRTQSVAFLPQQSTPAPGGTRPQSTSPKERRSIFGFLRSDSTENKLTKKKSSMF